MRQKNLIDLSSPDLSSFSTMQHEKSGKQGPIATFAKLVAFWRSLDIKDSNPEKSTTKEKKSSWKLKEMGDETSTKQIRLEFDDFFNSLAICLCAYRRPCFDLSISNPELISPEDAAILFNNLPMFFDICIGISRDLKTNESSLEILRALISNQDHIVEAFREYLDAWPLQMGILKLLKEHQRFEQFCFTLEHFSGVCGQSLLGSVTAPLEFGVRLTSLLRALFVNPKEDAMRIVSINSVKTFYEKLCSLLQENKRFQLLSSLFDSSQDYSRMRNLGSTNMNSLTYHSKISEGFTHKE